MHKETTSVWVVLGLITVGAFSHTSNYSADRIREAFSQSDQKKLQLAAKALGDESLIQFFEEWRQQPGNTKHEDILKQLTGPQ